MQRALHDTFGPWGWTLTVGLGLLTGVGVVGPARNAARPHAFGMFLMLFACYDCWPDEIAVPGALLAVRLGWAALRSKRQNHDEKSAASKRVDVALV